MSRRASAIAKGFALIFLLWHHLFYSADVIAEKGAGIALVFWPLTQVQAILIARSLKVCVAIFVFVTGYGTYVQVSRLLTRRGGKHASAEKEESVSAYCLRHHVSLLMSYQLIFVITAAIGTITGLHTLRAEFGGNGIVRAALYCIVDFMGLARAMGTPTFNGTWWYMSLAILLIYLVPLLTILSRKVGSFPILVITCIAPNMLSLQTTGYIEYYLPAAMLGMVCAQYRLFDGIMAQKGARDAGTARSLAIVLIGFALMALLLYTRNKHELLWLTDTLCAALLCCACCALDRFDWVARPLAFVGRHSSNIYMFHTFVYATYTPGIIYGFRYVFAILIGLLGICLVLSVALEELKRLMRFKDATQWVSGRLCAVLERRTP